MGELLVFTDGGCSGNPGPGGWAWLLVDPDATPKIIHEAWGGEKGTTNNRMELSAVIGALEYVKATADLSSRPITLYTDSQYVQKGITQWIHSWKRNGWRTASKEPVKNRELWQELDALAAAGNITWRWVKGHAGHEYNERCDELTQVAIASLRT